MNDPTRPHRQAPLPPIPLAARVGARHADQHALYDEVGRAMREDLLEVLPPGWSFEGKRVLDFGCGAGRTLRHFVEEAEVAEIWGCDIHAESIAWLQQNLDPPMRFVRCDEEPPLPFDDGSFDLIWAISVFTHLSDSWAAWLSELHRLLVDDGLLVATFLGRRLSETISGEPWDEDRIGMNVLRWGEDWERGGPMVLHSPWWLREHWGRAFDIEDLRDEGFAVVEDTGGQGILLCRKRAGRSAIAELERIDPAEPREILALRHQVDQLRRESKAARDASARLESERDAPAPQPATGAVGFPVRRRIRDLRRRLTASRAKGRPTS